MSRSIELDLMTPYFWGLYLNQYFTVIFIFRKNVRRIQKHTIVLLHFLMYSKKISNKPYYSLRIFCVAFSVNEWKAMRKCIDEGSKNKRMETYGLLPLKL